MKRQSAVAGQFYPGTESDLRSNVATMLPRTESKRKVIAIVAPHAGYVYSGAIAGQVYAAIEIPKTVLILGPNHRGAGQPLALYPEGSWQTPLGEIPIDASLTALLADSVPFIQQDAMAHQYEHSLEVQLPFIRYLRPDVSLSAICVGHSDNFDILRQIGTGIASAILQFGQDVLIIASSDMTHYESADSARQKDSSALEHVLKLDPQGLLQICHTNKISMCGVVPTAIMLTAAQALGATKAELIAYGTSGDVTRDNRQVVGYAALTVW